MLPLRMLAPAVAILLAAGCVGTEEPLAEGTVAEGSSEASLPDVCPEEGCAECGRGEACGGFPLMDDTPASFVAVPFEFTGNSGGAVCPPAARGHCVVLEESRVDAPELQADRAVGLHANVTWDARTAATSSIYASLLVDRGEGWEWDPETSPTAEGQSPLPLSWDLSGYPESAKFLLYFECFQALDAGPARASVTLPQDFAVAGVFVHATR